MSNTTENLPKLKIIRGKYSEWKEQVDALGVAHWEETGMPGADGLEVNIDMDVYLQMEESGRHLGLGILEGAELIGYLSIFIYPHHQHKTTWFAQTDGFFVNPKKRGFRTFKAIHNTFLKAESILKKEYGVEYLLLNTNAKNDLKFLAESLSFVPTAVMYLKRL